jgi:hypothetical protein
MRGAYSPAATEAEAGDLKHRQIVAQAGKIIAFPTRK